MKRGFLERQERTNMDELYLEPTAFSIWPFVIYGVFFIVTAVLFALAIRWIKHRFTRPEMLGLSREDVAKRWLTIRETSKNGLIGAKLAILEADNLLDSGLKSMMMPGDTLGERLKVACYKYPKLQNVWWAHKLRNQLAHEATFQISTRQASQALDEFEKALKTLNIL